MVVLLAAEVSATGSGNDTAVNNLNKTEVHEQDFGEALLDFCVEVTDENEDTAADVC